MMQAQPVEAQPTFPPGPPGGMLRMITSMRKTVRDPFGMTEEIARQYGDPFSIPTFEGPLVVTWDPAATQAIFAADPDTLAPNNAEVIAALLGPGTVLGQEGATHKRSRKLLNPPFHGARMRAYARLMAETTVEHAAALADGRAFAMMDLAQAISLDVILKAVFGVSDPERMSSLRQLAIDVLGLSPVVVGMKFLRRRFAGIGPWAKHLRLRDAFDTLLVRELAARRASPEGREDVLSLLVAARYDDGSAMDDREIFDQLLTIVLAGHETTAITIAWVFELLHRHPEALERLRAELAPLGPTPDPEALTRQEFLRAVIDEAMRLYPIAAVVGRKLLAPMTVRGYTLPAGCSVGPSPYLAHRREELFPEPARFRPERFLERSYSPFEFFPYGGGARRCLGAAFASFEMKIVIGTLLAAHRFALLDEKPARAVLRTATIGPDGGIRMKIAK